MRNYARWGIFLAVEWWILLLPKQFNLFSCVTDPVQRLVYPLVTAVFGNVPFAEDSTGMYLLIPVSIVLGGVSALLVFTPFFRRQQCNPLAALKIVLRYFLVLELWEYGWIKLVKAQFYMPEPNTVYTELGNLSKDIAYWSVMGSSPAYVLFLGITELLAGTLLLFRRTRFVGLLLAAGIFTNVLMVNVAFDISVKLFAATLLLMTLALLAGYPNHWRALFGLTVRTRVLKTVAGPGWKPWARAGVVALFVVETVYPSVMSGIFYDDAAPRPPYHGAYAIRGHAQLKNLYVHRQGYVIFEDRNGIQLDQKVLAQNGGDFTLLDERTQRGSLLSLEKSGGIFRAVLAEGGRSDTLIMNALPYRKLPLLNGASHWFSDRYH